MIYPATSSGYGGAAIQDQKRIPASRQMQQMQRDKKNVEEKRKIRRHGSRNYIGAISLSAAVAAFLTAGDSSAREDTSTCTASADPKEAT